MVMGPTKAADLGDPAFIVYLDTLFPDRKIKPDPEDFDLNANPKTVAEQASEYRSAVARKIIRLYGQWKAAQN
jgi:hypothetical protein